MPLVRCAVTDGPPLVVRWRSLPGIDVAVRRSSEASAASPDADDDVVEISAGDPGPEYEFVSTMDGEPSSPERQEVLPRASAPDEVPLGNSVEATLVHLAIDERGRIWGMARFEVVASEPLVRMRFPPGMRLFDVLVDGREAHAMPVESSAWDVRLHDVRWPRSILAVFAGDVGSLVDSGDAVLLEPPRLEGLPCRDMLWTIDVPAGLRVRVAEPARVVDAGVWRAAQAEVQRRVTAVFAAAMAPSNAQFSCRKCACEVRKSEASSGANRPSPAASSRKPSELSRTSPPVCTSRRYRRVHAHVQPHSVVTTSSATQDVAFAELDAYLTAQAPLVALLYNAAANVAGRSREQAQLLLEYGVMPEIVLRKKQPV
jgi:hypothetical protein